MLCSKWLGECSTGKFRTWADLKFLRENWDGPFKLKCIQTVQDAEKATDYTDDIVANHRGRQVDGGIPSLYSLDQICQSPKIKAAQKAGTFAVLFDSRLKTGSEIIKALALGAQAVLLGRPYIYGLIGGGKQGVEEVIAHTLADFEIILGLSGFTSVGEVQGKREEVVVRLPV